MRAATPVGMVLFPTVDPDVGGLVIEPLDTRAARALMARSLMKPSHPTRYSPLFGPEFADERIAPDLEADRCRRLVEAVPVSRCRLGPDAYGGNLLQALRASVEIRRTTDPSAHPPLVVSRAGSPRAGPAGPAASRLPSSRRRRK
jgi:hypothetical protein